MNREQLIDIINDTIFKCENEYKWMIDNAVNLFYDENYFNSYYKINKFQVLSKIRLIRKTTVEAIIENSDRVYGVLNFASAKHPGGGVLKGTVAQEEALARASSLYPVIKKCPDFYGGFDDIFYTDKIIYSKPIYVFKDDFGNDIDPIECDVITCAAPDYRFFNNIILDKHTKVIRQRFDKVIQSAIVNNQRNLILGAWGCGVFRNPPDINAQIFREVLNNYSNYFDDIIFAIPDDRNYQIFQENLF